MTHSHFQALGSTQAPVNSSHLLSSARPLTLCSHLSGSHHCLAETGPQPSPQHWLCRWGINPSAMPVPTRSVGKAPGWAAPQITVRSLLPSCGLTRLLGSVLLPSTWTAELLFACQGKDRPKKMCQGPKPVQPERRCDRRWDRTHLCARGSVQAQRWKRRRKGITSPASPGRSSKRACCSWRDSCGQDCPWHISRR